MNSPRRKVWVFDPDDRSEEPWMEFRLTYQGPLYSTQVNNKSGRTRSRKLENKHRIRQNFHRQLKQLWEITPFLKAGQGTEGVTLLATESTPEHLVYDIETLSKRFFLYGFNFVPLVTSGLNLMCGIDVLFLRPSKPGSVYAGDLDNRIKTLLDAMRVPEGEENYSIRIPELDEKPFFCLLEDDKLITKLSVETDRLLDIPDGKEADHEVSLVITIRLRPFEPNYSNLQFG